MNYFEDHIGDYAAATAHLSWDEDMAYTRLIRAYYHTERPIPKDQTYRLARATTPAQRKAVDTVIAEFFWLGDDGYHQKRCDEEIARYQDKQSKAKASANKRWAHVQAASEGNANASANAMRTHMPTHSEGNAPRARPQSPDTRHQSPEEDSEVSGFAPSATNSPPTPIQLNGHNGHHPEPRKPRGAIAPLPPDWDLPEEWGNDAEKLGWRTADILRESEKFRQYWTAGRGTGTRRSPVGWRQSWSTWLDKASRRAA